MASHSDHSPEKSDQLEHDDNGSQDIPGNAKVVEALNADYAAALATGPQLKATSARSLQLFAILLVAFMGSLSNGFDGSGESSCFFPAFYIYLTLICILVMSAINAMKLVGFVYSARSYIDPNMRLKKDSIPIISTLI